MGIIPPGLLPGHGGVLGVPLCIEVKTGTDSLRPEQVGFLTNAARMGAITMVVKDFQDFLNQWNKIINK